MRGINPANEEAFDLPREHSGAEVEAALGEATAAFGEWRRTSMTERAGCLRRAGDMLRREKAELARLMAMEMGKPVTAGEGEVEKCAATCDYFSEHAAGMLREIEVGSDAAESYVRFDPLGAVFAIMPWNFPLWQVFRFAAPALMAGNVGVLKHAPNVPGCAGAIERILREACGRAGVFTNLFLDNAGAAGVIAHEAIAAVTLTGSERAGIAVASEAGKVLKKAVLELGGSDAFIVMGDVDVEETAVAAAEARCINAGQSCIAAKRFIVEKGIAKRFEEAMARAMNGMVVGDPLERGTQVGPLARRDLLENLEDQVRRSVAMGARVVCGGERLAGKGFYYRPTLLAEVKKGMAVFDEETFGPVAALVICEGAEDAVRLANASRYGLGASIWTKDLALAKRMAGELEAGAVFVNGAVKSDARLPFGGVKRSGYGRELSEFGIREFVNVKTVWVG